MPKVAKPRKAKAKVAKRARVVVRFDTAEPTIEEGWNVEALTEAANGNEEDFKYLFVHFDIPFADELYRCDVIPSEPVNWEIKARKKEGVGIRLATPWPRKIKIVCEQV